MASYVINEICEITSVDSVIIDLRSRPTQVGHDRMITFSFQNLSAQSAEMWRGELLVGIIHTRSFLCKIVARGDGTSGVEERTARAQTANPHTR